MDIEKLHNLEDMGFSTKKSAEALKQSNNDMNGALEVKKITYISYIVKTSEKYSHNQVTTTLKVIIGHIISDKKVFKCERSTLIRSNHESLNPSSLYICDNNRHVASL